MRIDEPVMAPLWQLRPRGGCLAVIRRPEPHDQDLQRTTKFDVQRRPPGRAGAARIVDAVSAPYLQPHLALSPLLRVALTARACRPRGSRSPSRRRRSCA